MNVFELRDSVINEYQQFVSGFLNIRDQRIRDEVEAALNTGHLWPDPYLSLNPKFQPGGRVDELAREGLIDPRTAEAFRVKNERHEKADYFTLHQHQVEAIEAARTGSNYVLTTGTGSGKSLTYLIPIVDHVTRNGSGNGIKAIIVYPMNALANSQLGELEKFLDWGFPQGPPVRFAQYTGQQNDEERRAIFANPPDILLTNYVMLELMLTRSDERKGLIPHASGLRFLVLDELHTYRGRQGADVALLVRRTRDACQAEETLQHIGTSATLASGGSLGEQRSEVAGVATIIFGAPVTDEHVIGETLQRATDEIPDAGGFLDDLRSSITDRHTFNVGTSGFDEFIKDPLSRWLEDTIGLARVEGQLVRAEPRKVDGPDGIAQQLAKLTGLEITNCSLAVRQRLLDGSRVTDPATGAPVFAFRLHQFVSRGSNVFATPESPSRRIATMNDQQYVPGDRSKRLFPLAFCRECGEDYYLVERSDGQIQRRDLGDRDLDKDADGHPRRRLGFLHLADDPFPEESESDYFDLLPQDWVEPDESGWPRVRRARRKYQPERVWISPDGAIHETEHEGSIAATWVPIPFTFCLNCGVAYAVTQRTDFTKLTTLGFEGRSTATTMLTLSALRYLDTPDAADTPSKLLDFTDNRQDASLQAGHFNDFVRTSLIRAAVYKAAVAAVNDGEPGLTADELGRRVFQALDLPFGSYAANPDANRYVRGDVDRALQQVLEYRVLQDLRGEWRVTAPNLEQCGLIRIAYRHLDDLSHDEDLWSKAAHPWPVVPPSQRAAAMHAVLDWMRRDHLAITARPLDPDGYKTVFDRSQRDLSTDSPWGLDESEEWLGGERAKTVVLRPRRKGESDTAAISNRGAVGRYLRRVAFDPSIELSMDETTLAVETLFDTMAEADLVRRVGRADDGSDVWQVSEGALIWVPDEGTRPARDPIRVPRGAESSADTSEAVSQFFVGFYRSVAETLQGKEAREHTAQVPAELRQQREEMFKADPPELAVLFCSPTMELGIDIASLNVVGMRNVPPTPANYAQRSGRAGRSGQPAFVVVYCSTGSAHDQFYFNHPTLMVAGKVAPPRLDLANEDLVRAHIHAIWLAETGARLGSSLTDILDTTLDERGRAALTLNPDIADDLKSEPARARTGNRARKVLASVEDLDKASWWDSSWLDRTIAGGETAFRSALDRWISMYRAAESQFEIQTRNSRDHSKNKRERDQSSRMAGEARRMMDLLAAAETGSNYQSDFYSYRYFASEGFLPGYNFPRLPLSAYIPGRRGRRREDDIVNRPRFIAIREFGPQARIYHEGSVYRVDRVVLPIEQDPDTEAEQLNLRSAVICDTCGHLARPGQDGVFPDLCSHCSSTLDFSGQIHRNLFRMTTVAARRDSRIHATVEERERQGYEIRTAFSFAEREGRSDKQAAEVISANGDELASLTYGHTATLTQVNLGWMRRANPHEFGFWLDLERGRWAKNPNDDAPDDSPQSKRPSRVVPFVEDRRNALIVKATSVDSEINEDEDTRLRFAASLQAVVKHAIGTVYQLEDNELAVEPLPNRQTRSSFLLYEAAEGGAGVLRLLVETTEALAEVAEAALERIHYQRTDAGGWIDVRRADGASFECEAACYDCLLSYTNQPDHDLCDRQLIKDTLVAWSQGSVTVATGPEPREDRLRRLRRLAQSDLELEFIGRLDRGGFRLPDDAQVLLEEFETRPDFIYRTNEGNVAVYVDGHHHDYPNRVPLDEATEQRLLSGGWSVIRFRYDDTWDEIFSGWRSVFGEGRGNAS